MEVMDLRAAGEANSEGGPETKENWFPRLMSVLQFLKKCLLIVTSFVIEHFQVVGLVVAFIIALSWPAPGKAVYSARIGEFNVVTSINVMTIFLVSGLALELKYLKEARRQWYPLIVGLISIMFATTSIAFGLVRLPFNPPAYAYGLSVFCLVPATLASAVALVAIVNGNVPLAYVLSVITNFCAVFMMPFSIQLVIKRSAISGFDATNLLVKLVVTMTSPLLVGQACRLVSSWVRKQVAKHRVPLGLLSNLSLHLIVWQAVSDAQSSIVHTAFGTLCLVALAGFVLHLVYMALNLIIVVALRFPKNESLAIYIMASQKNLVLSLTVSSYLPSQFGSAGQLFVPCVLAHLAQLLVDYFIVRITARYARGKNAVPELIKIEDLNSPAHTASSVQSLDNLDNHRSDDQSNSSGEGDGDGDGDGDIELGSMDGESNYNTDKPTVPSQTS